MHEKHLAGLRLAELAGPYLHRNDRAGLANALSEHWSPECLALLLDAPDGEIRRIAATCLGLVGDLSDCPRLLSLLYEDDVELVSAAEDGLWTIWFRQGGEVAQRVLLKIAAGIRNHDTENVIPMLTELIHSHPGYAESFHQRAQAFFLEGDAKAALRDARRALELNPYHFGALAVIAGSYAEMGQYQQALETYRDVLRMHPLMPRARSAVRQLQRKLSPAAKDAPAPLTLVTDAE